MTHLPPGFGKILASAGSAEAHVEQPTSSTPKKMAYRIDEACYVLGIGRTSLYALVKSGRLKLIKIAGRSLVPGSELERLTRI